MMSLKNNGYNKGLIIPFLERYVCMYVVPEFSGLFFVLSQNMH